MAGGFDGREGVRSALRMAVVVAHGREALEVVGGLPLAARAVLALRAAGYGEVAVLAGAERGPLEAILVRRGVPVRWLSGPDDARGDGGGEPVLLVPGHVLVDPRGVLRAPTCPEAALPEALAGIAGGRPLIETVARVGGTDWCHGPATVSSCRSTPPTRQRFWSGTSSTSSPVTRLPGTAIWRA